MKTKTLFLFGWALIACLTASSQSILNPSFEQWKSDTLYQEPQGYNTSNLLSYLVSGAANVTRTSDSYSGQSAVRLQTIAAAGDTVQGILYIGDIGNNFLSGGLPYSDRPVYVSIAVKYNLMAGDTALLMMAFMKNGNIGGLVQHQLYGAQTIFQSLTSPITWLLPPGVYPDSLILLASSSNFDYPAIPGSYLIIDNLGFPDAGVAPIPNGGFETWNSTISQEPIGWTTFNSYLIQDGVASATQSIDAYHGSYSLRLETRRIFDDTIGFITNGRLISDGAPAGGLAVAANPYKLTGFYKYLGVGPDTALATMFAWATDDLGVRYVVDSVIIALPPANTYTPFSMELTYNGWPRADTLTIAFSSSQLLSAYNVKRPGSTLYIDSLNLMYFPLSVQDVTTSDAIQLYPNPARDKVVIETKNAGESMKISVFDSFGRLFDQQFHPSSFPGISLDLSHLPDALYLIVCEQAGQRQVFKLIKAR